MRRALVEGASLTSRDARPGVLAEADAFVTRVHAETVETFLATEHIDKAAIAIVGFPKPVELDPMYILNRHLRIIGCEPFLRYNLQVMKLMEYKRVNCKPLISEIMPLTDVQKAFDSLYEGKNLLVMLKP